nr:Amigo1 protein [Mus musculus]
MQPQRDLRGLWLLLLSVFLLLFEVARAGRSVVSCPANCLCASNILSCSKQQLPNVPQSLPSYTALLDLSHNNLSRLRAEWTPTRLTNLHSLLLSHNHLNFISSEAFVPVPNLGTWTSPPTIFTRWMSSCSATCRRWKCCCSTITTLWWWTGMPLRTWPSCRNST